MFVSLSINFFFHESHIELNLTQKHYRVKDCHVLDLLTLIKTRHHVYDTMVPFLGTEVGLYPDVVKGKRLKGLLVMKSYLSLMLGISDVRVCVRAYVLKPRLKSETASQLNCVFDWNWFH